MSVELIDKIKAAAEARIVPSNGKVKATAKVPRCLAMSRTTDQV